MVIHSRAVNFQHNFLLTWEALILHLLSPMDAEVLTYEIDKQNKEEDWYMLISFLVF